MHSSLAITQHGLPLGLCAVKFWSRKQFKGTQALKKRINPTRIPIEGKRPAIYTVQRLQTPEQVST